MDGGESQHSRHERICITCTGRTSQDPMDPRFGRCSYFLLVDGSGSEFKAVENSARGLGNGAGIQAAQTIANLDVTVLITGDLGPNAFRVLSAAGIRTYQSAGGTVADVLSQYRAGRLHELLAPTGPGHHGHGGQGPRWMDGRQ